MSLYVCLVCGYAYDTSVGDPQASIPPNTDFNALPEDWGCPDCGTSADNFFEYSDRTASLGYSASD
jgi:rubredoxin